MERDYITVAGNKRNQILCLPRYLFIWPFLIRRPPLLPFPIPAILLSPLSSSKLLRHSSLFRFIPLSHPPFLSFFPSPPSTPIPRHFCKEKKFVLHFCSALALMCLLIRGPGLWVPLPSSTEETAWLCTVFPFSQLPGSLLGEAWLCDWFPSATSE